MKTTQPLNFPTTASTPISRGAQRRALRCRTPRGGASRSAAPTIGTPGTRTNFAINAYSICLLPSWPPVSLQREVADAKNTSSTCGTRGRVQNYLAFGCGECYGLGRGSQAWRMKRCFSRQPLLATAFEFPGFCAERTSRSDEPFRTGSSRLPVSSAQVVPTLCQEFVKRVLA